MDLETDLTLWWAIPFVSVLGSIALCPLAYPKLWHHHYGKVVLSWALGLVLAMGCFLGLEPTVHLLSHTLITHYVPFMILLCALFTIAGGIHMQAKFRGSPLTNTLLLGMGTIFASVIGTTGALVLLIRPLILANQARVKRTHLIVFLILLVGNIGGALSPLGDPPLFVGYLLGVDFLWPLKNLWAPFLIVVIPILLLFYFWDRVLLARETEVHHPKNRQRLTFDLTGKINLVLLVGLLTNILLTSQWQDNSNITILGTHVSFSDLARDIVLILLALLSIRFTAPAVRRANKFSWEPMREVALIFLAIFITVTPIMIMLAKQETGVFSSVIDALRNPDGTHHLGLYFWVTGLFSAVLDNAPTYLVFFKVAGGNAHALMGEGYRTLMAISCGAVFMGALTYIGNAPNFMAKVIAEEQGIEMPSFFVYSVISCVILLPLFILLSFIFFS